MPVKSSFDYIWGLHENFSAKDLVFQLCITAYQTIPHMWCHKPAPISLCLWIQWVMSLNRTEQGGLPSSVSKASAGKTWVVRHDAEGWGWVGPSEGAVTRCLGLMAGRLDPVGVLTTVPPPHLFAWLGSSQHGGWILKEWACDGIFCVSSWVGHSRYLVKHQLRCHCDGIFRWDEHLNQ